jgi:hypothetical protein
LCTIVLYFSFHKNNKAAKYGRGGVILQLLAMENTLSGFI